MGRASKRKWERRKHDPRWQKHIAENSDWLTGANTLGRRNPLPPRQVKDSPK